MTTYMSAAVPPLTGSAPTVVTVDPNLYMNHSLETIIPELNSHLTTVGISTSEVLNKFLRILLTGELCSNAQSLLDTELGLSVNISYDPMMHDVKETKLRFKVNKPFISEPVELGKSAPCGKSSIVEKGCKRISHCAGVGVEVELIRKIYWILSKTEEELRSKLSGLEEILIKYERLRKQSLDSLSQSFKRGTVRNLLNFIREIAPDIHIVWAIRRMMSNSSIKDLTPVQIVHMMKEINDSFTKNAFICNSSHLKFMETLNKCISMTNGHRLLSEIDYAAKGFVCEENLLNFGKGKDFDIDEYQVVGVLIVGSKTKDLLMPKTSGVKILTDTRRGIIGFAKSDYKSSISSGIVVSEARMQGVLDKLASLHILNDKSTSVNDYLTVLRGQVDPYCNESDCFGGNNGIKTISANVLQTSHGYVSVYSASEMFQLLNKSYCDICRDSLHVLSCTVLGTTSAMNKNSSRRCIDELPTKIYWKNAEASTVEVSQKDMLPFLCIPQLYNDGLLKHLMATNSVAKELYSVARLVKYQCPMGTTFFTNVYHRGSLMDRSEIAWKYIGNVAKTTSHLMETNYHLANDLVQLELSPFMDVVVSRKNGRNCTWKKIKIEENERLPSEKLKVEIFPRLLGGNVPMYLQENICRVKMGENYASHAQILEQDIGESLNLLQRSLCPETGFNYKFYVCQYFLMVKYGDARELIHDAEKLVKSDMDMNKLLLTCFRAIDADFEDRNVISLCTNRMILQCAQHVCKNQRLKIHISNILNCVEKIFLSLMDMVHHGAQILNPDECADEAILATIGKKISWICDPNVPCPVPMRGIFSNLPGKHCDSSVHAFVASRNVNEEDREKYTGSEEEYRSWKAVSSLEETFDSEYADVVKDKIYFLMLSHLSNGKISIGHINPDNAVRNYCITTSTSFDIKCTYTKWEEGRGVSEIKDEGEKLNHFNSVVLHRNEELFNFFGVKRREDGTFVNVGKLNENIRVTREALSHGSEATDYFASINRRRNEKTLTSTDLQLDDCVFRSMFKPGDLFTTDNLYTVSNAFTAVGMIFLDARDNAYQQESCNESPLARFPFISPLAANPVIATRHFKQWLGAQNCTSTLDICPDIITYSEYFSSHRLNYINAIEKMSHYSAFQKTMSIIPMNMYLNPVSFCVSINYTQHFGYSFVLCRNDIVNTESGYFARSKALQIRQGDSSAHQYMTPSEIITEVYEYSEMNEILSGNSSAAMPHITFTGYETDLDFHLRNYAQTNTYGIDTDIRTPFKLVYEYLNRNKEDETVSSGIEPSWTDVILAPSGTSHTQFETPRNPRGGDTTNVYVHSSQDENLEGLMFSRQGQIRNPWAQNLLSVSDVLHRHTAQPKRNPSHRKMFRLFSVPEGLKSATVPNDPAFLFKKLMQESRGKNRKRIHEETDKYISNFSLADAHHATATLNCGIPMLSYSHPCVVHDFLRTAASYKIKPHPYESQGHYIISSENCPYARTGLYDDIFTPYSSPV